MSIEPVSRIAVGVDGSDDSRRAMELATRLAAGSGAEIVAVHAFQPLDHLDEVNPDTDFAKLEDEARERLESKWCRIATAEGVSCTPVVSTGTPSDVLIDAVEQHDCDLIVVGARGLGAVKSLVLGSTSMKLTQVSKVPIVIVPPDHD